MRLIRLVSPLVFSDIRYTVKNVAYSARLIFGALSNPFPDILLNIHPSNPHNRPSLPPHTHHTLQNVETPSHLACFIMFFLDVHMYDRLHTKCIVDYIQHYKEQAHASPALKRRSNEGSLPPPKKQFSNLQTATATPAQCQPTTSKPSQIRHTRYSPHTHASRRTIYFVE